MLSFNIVKAQDKLIPYLTKNKEETKGKIKSCKICGDPSASEICKACSLKEQLSNL